MKSKLIAFTSGMNIYFDLHQAIQHATDYFFDYFCNLWNSNSKFDLTKNHSFSHRMCLLLSKKRKRNDK